MHPYKKINVRQLTSLILGCALIVGLSACGGGGSSSAPTPVSPAPSSSSSSSLSSSSSSSVSSIAPESVTYKVTVDIPAALLANPQTFIPQQKSGRFTAAAVQSNKADHVTVDNFAVACVDLSGRILELIQLSDNSVGMNEDGSWNITVPQSHRLDCLIVVHVSQPLHLNLDEYITEAEVLYSPTTANTINVNVLSTAAFKSFIGELGGAGTFDDAGIDTTDSRQIMAVNNVVTNIATLLATNGVSSATTLAEILSEVEPLIAPVVAQEVENIKNPVASTAVELVRDGGGMHIFNSGSNGITYQSLVDSTLTNQHYQGNSFIPSEVENPNRDFILSSNGWVQRSGNTILDFSDEEGTVALVDADADGDKTIYRLTQGFDLGGRKIADVLKSNSNTAPMASMVDPDAVFPTEANGYRLETSTPTRYRVSYEPGDANSVCWMIEDMLASHANGNCNQQELRLDANIFQRPVVTYESMFSPDVAVNEPGSRTLPVGAVETADEAFHLDVQLLNDGSHTARFYARSWEGTSYLRLIDTGTWREFTLPNGNPVLYFEYPQSVLAVANIWSFQTYQAYTVQDGFVRHLRLDDAQTTPGILVLNNAAAQSVLDAMAKTDETKTAAACFNPAIYEEGARSVERYREYLSDGAVYDKVSEVEVRGSIDLDGRTALHSVAVEVTYGAPEGYPDTSTVVRYFTIDNGAKHFGDLGYKIESSFGSDVVTGGFTYDPGELVRFDLNAGESYTQSYSVKSGYASGVSEAIPFPTTFAGIEEINVSAGIYEACRFDFPSRSAWYMVGTGIKIKETYSGGAGGMELVSYSGNGINL